jgi:oligo-1,6-glucosidase
MMMKKLLVAFSVAGLLAACQSGEPKKEATPANKDWWKEAVVYQLYPRSFKDSDGDGVGDLKGIIEKLDYLKSLGVDAVWLNPIYTSPNADNGYDVSDYRGIQPEYGTMQDFDALLKGLHERGIKLVMDVVVNHSSNEHEWFKQSRSSRDNPYRNYYHWWPAEKARLNDSVGQGKPPFRYSLFDINHDAWKYDSLTNAYYLHYFAVQQPDLNWENPKVRQEIYDMMRFWADKGVDGFRLDAFQFAAKDTTWPAFPKGFEKDFVQYYAMQPGLHTYLQEMNREVFSKYNVMSVAEGAGRSIQEAHELVDADRNELNMAYAFEAIDLAKSSGYDFLQFKNVLSKWDSAFSDKGWLSIFLASHDQARLLSRWVKATPEQQPIAGKMLNTLLLSMRGTPYCYYGDELGMSNPGFTKLEDYRDGPALNDYAYRIKNGATPAEVLAEMSFSCRDNGRTPMQWNSSPHAGFTSGTPWIAVNPNYTTLNVDAQERDENSPLQYFKKMIALRKEHKALVHGKYTLLDASNTQVYAYTREWEGKKYLVLLNFSNTQASVNTGLDLKDAKLLINNYGKARDNTAMRPFEAAIYQL